MKHLLIGKRMYTVFVMAILLQQRNELRREVNYGGVLKCMTQRYNLQKTGTKSRVVISSQTDGKKRVPISTLHID